MDTLAHVTRTAETGRKLQFVKVELLPLTVRVHASPLAPPSISYVSVACEDGVLSGLEEENESVDGVATNVLTETPKSKRLQLRSVATTRTARFDGLLTAIPLSLLS